MSAIESNVSEIRPTITIASLLECRGLSVLSLIPPPHIGVRWNEKVDGGHDCHGACSHGYGWFVTPSDIKRIDDDDEFDADTTEFDKLFESFSREAIS